MEYDELYHWGIKGMKWGRRKDRSSGGSTTGSTKPKRVSKKEPKKRLQDMSDQELRNTINRMQMEKQYKQLTARNTSYGRKFVIDVLSNAAKQTATNYASKYMTKGVDTLIESFMTGVNSNKK